MTVLSACCFPLPAVRLTLLFAQLDHTITVGGPLEHERFEHALAATLSQWPHLVARLAFCPRRKQWRFLLKNEACPVTYVTTDELGPFADDFDYHPHPGVWRVPAPHAIVCRVFPKS